MATHRIKRFRVDSRWTGYTARARVEPTVHSELTICLSAPINNMGHDILLIIYSLLMTAFSSTMQN